MPDVLVDTGLWVYAVVPTASTTDGLPSGVDGTAVELVTLEDLAAVVSEVDVDRPPGRRAELDAHGAVLDALAASGPAVPVQFGSLMLDRESVVADLLDPGYEHFTALLQRLEGLTQLRVRVDYLDGTGLSELVRAEPEIMDLRRATADLPAGLPHPDLVRLGELVARGMAEKRAEDADDVWAVLEPLTVEHAPREVSGVDEVMDTTLLVERERVPEVEEALEALAEAVHERMRVRLTGPMPAYDFVGPGAWA